MCRFRFFSVLLVCFCLHCGLLFAETQKDESKPGLSASRDTSRQNRYESLEETPSELDLVETQNPKTLELSLNPQFEDAIERDVVRYRFRLKYGITENLAVRGEFVWFTGNPAKSDEWHTDVSNASLGIKYKFKKWPGFAGIRSAVGFNYEFPLGSPPQEIVDGYSRYRPYIAFSRFLESNPRIQTFLNTTLTFVGDTPFREKPGKKRPDHSLKITTGGIYYTSVMRYVCEVSYRTTAIDGGSDNEVFVTPGIVWNIPRESTSFLPGSWQLSTGVEIPITNEDENYRVFAKLKWDLDLFRKKVRFGEESGKSQEEKN